MRRLAVRFAPTLAALLLALAPQAARAASSNPCGGADDHGMGGTGLQGDGGKQDGDERGMGGTGAQDERGVGGTGLHAKQGVGGTGFFGTLTGFGSVCINGQPVRYDADTRVERNGAPQPISDLRAGQTVLVDAVQDGAGFRAARVEVQPAVTGTVTRVDSADQRVEVLLQVVEAPGAVQRSSRLALTDLRPGDRIAVHGLRDPDGVIRATRLERAPEAAPASVTGRLRGLPDGGQAIGRLRVEGALGGDEAARPVRVTGSFVAAEGRLADARARPALDFAPGTRSASVETWVAERAGSRLETPLLTIDTARASVVPTPPEVGSRVWAFGSLTPAGALDARLVEIDAIGGGAPVPPEWNDAAMDARDHPRAGRAGDVDDADDAGDGDDDGDLDDGGSPGDSDDVDDGGDLDDVDDSGDLDDVDDGGVPDVDDEGAPDLDDGGVPDIDDGGVPDVDDGGVPDIDDGGVPDIDDGGVPDIDDGDLPDVEDVDIPEIEAAELPEIDEVDLPEIEDAELPDIDDAAVER